MHQLCLIHLWERNTTYLCRTEVKTKVDLTFVFVCHPWYEVKILTLVILSVFFVRFLFQLFFTCFYGFCLRCSKTFATFHSFHSVNSPERRPLLHKTFFVNKLLLFFFVLLYYFSGEINNVIYLYFSCHGNSHRLKNDDFPVIIFFSATSLLRCLSFF